MSRTLNARDKRKRKKRSDFKKRHLTYRGKKLPKKRGRKIKFYSVKGKKTHIKLWIWERRKMSRRGINNWDKRLRGKIRKLIYLWQERIDAPVKELTNKENLEQWALDNISRPGEFLIMGCSFSPKTKTKTKWTKLFEVIIRTTEQGLIPRVSRLNNIYRYWFWEGTSPKRKIII